MVDRSGQPDVTRNVIEAHSTFSEDTRIEHTHDRSGQPDERNSSNAQIRTLLEEQRQMIIAEYCEKVGHHSVSSSTLAAQLEDAPVPLSGPIRTASFPVEVWKSFSPDLQAYTGDA